MVHRVLVIDDDPDIREVARMSLVQVGGMEVALASSGPEAIDLAPSFRPDVVLLDVMMPGMDGLATLERLRELPAMAGVPILLVTARILPRERGRYAALGSAGIIAKPFDPMTLPDQVREAVEQAT